MIEFRNVSKTYKSKKKVTTEALKNVSFTLPNTGMVFILGKSGSGKSTLLNILGGLDNCDSGEIYVDSKKISNFKENDYDYYRNTYVGFIFQEFNLIEEYNVYDNISLGLKLQKEKVKKEQLDQILEQVGLTGLGLRKINELSGGQKQRVAIARALIKNPNMILADEPTGSLDSETGKQIFDLLKQISREKLVVIVSHDVESANQYADGIIEIHDGVVVSNTIMLEPASQRAFVTKKSHLPWKDSFHLAVKSLLTKKIKMVVTIILVTMALVFFGVSTSLSSYDFPYTIAKVLLENGEHYIDLKKESGFLNENEVAEINQKTNLERYPVYSLKSNNTTVALELNRLEYLQDSENVMVYYMSYVGGSNQFIEADESFIEGEILGHYPKTYDEIMIHSYLADLIIINGVLAYSETEPNHETYFYPKDYDELLNTDQFILIGNHQVKVSGIILDDTAPFESLKTTRNNSVLNGTDSFLSLNDYSDIYSEFSTKIMRYGKDIYVKEGFAENIPLEPNTRLDTSVFRVDVTYQNRSYLLSSDIQYMSRAVEVDNGQETVEVTKLNDNEIIINASFLDKISNNEFSKQKDTYIEEHYDGSIPVSEVETEFVRNYLQEHDILNQEILIEFEQYNKNQKSSYTIKVVGYQNASDTIYIADNMATELQPANINISSIKVKVDNREDMEALIETFPTEDNTREITVDTVRPIISDNSYFTYFNSIMNLFEVLSGIAFIVSIIFAIFAIILLMNFIITSIFHSKKTIGILRGLGAKKTDVMKIFFQEGLLVGIISCILTGILLFAIIYFFNAKISSYFFFDVSFILFTPKLLLTLLLGVLIVIFISSLIAVYKISRMKPVDAISNK